MTLQLANYEDDDGGADAIFQAYHAVQSGGDDNLQHK